MTPETVTRTLSELFAPEVVAHPNPESWQVETPDLRLLVLLSEDRSWLRILLPIAPVQEAQPFFEQLLESNFDRTQEVRYGISQGMLWGVFQHAFDSLIEEDFRNAIARLASLKATGLNESFNQLVEQRMLQIIQAAKQQGQTLETTLQNLERFYAEGMLGGVEQAPQEREQFLAAWRARLTELWDRV